MKKFHLLLIALCVLIVVNFGLLVGVVVSFRNGKTCHSTNSKNVNLNRRIVGGQTVKIAAHPYMAGIVIKRGSIPGILDDVLLCGCSIISGHWAITAAHCYCLDKDLTENQLYISSNHAEWSKGSKHDVKYWTCHKEFTSGNLNNDIAMIMVDKPFKNKYEKSIPVASRKYKYKPRRLVMVIGWGYQQQTDDAFSKQLQGVKVPIIENGKCREMYRSSEITNAMFCAGYIEGGKDACKFDSGGPIFDRNLLIGIVSWGEGCAQKLKPGVYTRVGIFGNWIKSTIARSKHRDKVIFKDS